MYFQQDNTEGKKKHQGNCTSQHHTHVAMATAWARTLPNSQSIHGAWETQHCRQQLKSNTCTCEATHVAHAAAEERSQVLRARSMHLFPATTYFLHPFFTRGNKGGKEEL